MAASKKEREEGIKISPIKDVSDILSSINGSMKMTAGVHAEDASSYDSAYVTKYSTGILSLDAYLSVGGLLGGRIMNVWGWEGSGKTLMAYTAIAAVQAAGGKAAFLDAEGCVTGDTLVTDAKTGKRFTIESIVNGTNTVDFVPSVFLDKNHYSIEYGTGLVAARINSGIKECLSLVTKHGSGVKATLNHPVIVAGKGWVRLDEVRPGDFIARPKKFNITGHSEINPDLAKLIGYLIGDGCITGGTPRMSIYNAAVLQDVTELVKRLYGDRLIVKKVGRSRGTYGITLANSHAGSNPLKDKLVEYGLLGKRHYEKTVPTQLMTSNDTAIKALLGGLIGSDGSVANNRAAVTYSTVSKDLADQVKFLLHRLGVVASILANDDVRKHTYRKQYRVIAYGADNIRPLLDVPLVSYKATNLIAATSRPQLHGAFNSVPQAVAKIVATEARAAGISTEEYASTLGYEPRGSYAINNRAKTVPRSLLYNAKLKLGIDHTMWASAAVWWDEVTSVTNIGKRRVYDLSVDGSHSFVANDMIVHNTYAHNLATAVGVNSNELMLFRSTPERILTGEDYFAITNMLVQAGTDIVVVDSVPALIPSSRLTATINQGQKAVPAQMMSEGLSQVNAYLNAARKSVVWLINQIRAKPMVMFGPTEDHTGGSAIKFYASYSLELKKEDDIVMKVKVPNGNIEERKVGVTVRARLHKNKTAAIPEKAIFFDIYFSNFTSAEGVDFSAGVDIYKDMVVTAINEGVIQKSSSWFSWGDIKTNGEVAFIKELRAAGPEKMQLLRDAVLSRSK